MSTRTNFPRAAIFPRAVAAGAVLLSMTWATATRARADDLVLTGPHPGLKSNAVSLQFLYGSGLGDSFSGRGLGASYGLKMRGPLWLDLQLNFRAAACGPFRTCGTYSGSAVEVMPGIAWRFRTDIPVVPIVRGAAGFVFLYPQGGQSAVALAVRGTVGLKYYVYDWLGFGVEGALSLGHAYYAQGYGARRTYAVGDMSAGLEFQFR